MSHRFKTFLLLLGDITVLYVALVVTLMVRHGTLFVGQLVERHLVPFTILFVVWIVVFYIHNLYDLTAAKNTLEFFKMLLRALAISLAMAIAFFYLIPFFGVTPKTNLFLFLLIFALLYALWRRSANRILKRRMHVPTILAGSTERTVELADELARNPQMGYAPAVVFVTKPPGLSPRPYTIASEGDLVHLSDRVREEGVRTIVIERHLYRSEVVISELAKVLTSEIEMVDLDEFEERILRQVRLSALDDVWFFNHVARGTSLLYAALKRLFDVVFALAILPFALVLGLVAALAIKLEDHGPIFYTQTRVGKGGEPFVMYKFRTMRTDAEKTGAQWTVENDRRVTRVGSILRKTRIDEFPQLINILKGEMSFVGPRAERPEFHELLRGEIPFYERRYLVRPGLTGWAQINFTYGSSVEDTKTKLAYDFYYIKNRSFLFDCGIVLRTIDRVIRAMGR